jgi:hypothetical protein
MRESQRPCLFDVVLEQTALQNVTRVIKPAGTAIIDSIPIRLFGITLK